MKVSFSPLNHPTPIVKLDRLSLLSFFYHVLCILIAIIAIKKLSCSHENILLMPLVLSFLSYTIGYNILRFFLNNHDMTQGFLLIEYFFVLFLNYFIPELGWMEFLFIPVILLEFGLLCSLIKTIIVEIL